MKILLLLILTPLILHAESNKADDTEHLLDLLGIESETKTDDQRREKYEQWVDGYLAQLQKQVPDIPEEYLREYKEIYMRYYRDMPPLPDYRSAYKQFVIREHTGEEIKQLIQFYESDVGQKVLANRKKWRKEQKTSNEKAFEEWSNKQNELLVKDILELHMKYADVPEIEDAATTAPDSDSPLKEAE